MKDRPDFDDIMIIRKRMMAMMLTMLMTVTAFSQKPDNSLFAQFAMNGFPSQSSDCYDNYLVLVTKYESEVALYNLKKKKMCCVYHQEPKMEMYGDVDIYHANNSTFGLQRFKETDPFPLLYVSNRVNKEKRGVLDVLRLVPQKSEGAEDYDSLIVQNVQTIYYPVENDENALGSPWTVIDKENNRMYTYSRNNRSKAPNYAICRISKFKIPSVGESSEVYLNDEDILDSYEVDFKALYAQGACIHQGKMYVAQGISHQTGLWLRVIDLKKRKLIRNYDLKEVGFSQEPEGCFIYNNQLILATGSKFIFTMNIPIDK